MRSLRGTWLGGRCYGLDPMGTRACPRCGGTTIKEWSPGFFQCDGGRLPGDYINTLRPVPGGGAAPVTVRAEHRCSWRWWSPDDKSEVQPRCECGWWAGGRCEVCDCPVCIRHAEWDWRYGARCDDHRRPTDQPPS